MTSVINRLQNLKDSLINKNETPIDFNANFKKIKNFYIKKGFKKKIVYFKFLFEIEDGFYETHYHDKYIGNTTYNYKFYQVDNLNRVRFSPSDTHTLLNVRIIENKDRNHTASILLDNKLYKMYYMPHANVIVEQNRIPLIKDIKIVENTSPNNKIPIAEQVVHNNRSISNRSSSSSSGRSGISSNRSNSRSRSSSRSGGKKTRKNKKNKNKTQKKHK